MVHRDCIMVLVQSKKSTLLGGWITASRGSVSEWETTVHDWTCDELQWKHNHNERSRLKSPTCNLAPTWPNSSAAKIDFHKETVSRLLLTHAPSLSWKSISDVLELGMWGPDCKPKTVVHSVLQQSFVCHCDSHSLQGSTGAASCKVWISVAFSWTNQLNDWFICNKRLWFNGVVAKTIHIHENGHQNMDSGLSDAQTTGGWRTDWIHLHHKGHFMEFNMDMTMMLLKSSINSTKWVYDEECKPHWMLLKLPKSPSMLWGKDSHKSKSNEPLNNDGWWC